MLMVIEPAGSQFIDRDRLIAQGRWGMGRELPIDLRGKVLRGCQVSADARSLADPVLVVREVPDASTEIASHLANAERRRR